MSPQSKKKEIELYNSLCILEFFDDINSSKWAPNGSLLQNLYISTSGFLIIFGWIESICNSEDSIEVNSGQTVPLSVPSIVGTLKDVFTFKFIFVIYF